MKNIEGLSNEEKDILIRDLQEEIERLKKAEQSNWDLYRAFYDQWYNNLKTNVNESKLQYVEATIKRAFDNHLYKKFYNYHTSIGKLAFGGHDRLVKNLLLMTPNNSN